MKEVSLLLERFLGKEVVKQDHENVFLHVDNQDLVHITNEYVSDSEPIMQELSRNNCSKAGDFYKVRVDILGGVQV